MSDCLDSLRETLSSLDDKEIIQALRDIEALSRRTHAVMPDLVADIDSRGIAGRAGFGSTQRLVAGMWHLSVGEARARWPATAGVPSPGCDRPPGLCEAHHARHWIDGGETSVQNCCLLCPSHHHQVHQQGWDITIRGGRVEFRPPTIVEPNRHPLTNPLRR
jgi:hypothetical protein